MAHQPPPTASSARPRTSLSVRSVGPSPRSVSRPELSRTGVIRNAANVHKSSIMFKEGKLQFKFDSSLNTSFRIYFNVTEFLDEMKVPILASDLSPALSPSFPPGLDQICQVDLLPTTIAPHHDNVYSAIIETIPATDDHSASQLTYLSINEEFRITVVKQKLRYGERGYELHEIFGKERCSSDKSPNSPNRDSEDLNGGTDCVICLSNTRDTTIIPCLHLCLCSQCAQVLSLNTRKCPVCRTPATGLLHIDRDLPPPSPTSPRSPKHPSKQV